MSQPQYIRCPGCGSYLVPGYEAVLTCRTCGSMFSNPYYIRQPRSAPPPPAPYSRPDFTDASFSQTYGQYDSPREAPAAPVRNRRAGRFSEPEAQLPEGIERTYAPRWDMAAADPAAVPEKKPAPLPKWMIAAILAAVVLAFGGFIWQHLMKAELHDLHEQKISDYETLVSRHPLPDDYAPFVEKYAAEYNLQPAYVSAIIMNESSWRPQVSSRVGALGMMQLMKKTAGEVNDTLQVPGYVFETTMTDPETNIRFGCFYLNKLSRHFDGDPILTACAYHAGRANVDTWLLNPAYSDDGRTLSIDRIPMDDTKTYVGRVIRDYAIYDALYYRNLNTAETAINPPDGLSADLTAERTGQ